MKKLLAILLALAMVLAFTACGKSGDKDDDKKEDTKQEAVIDDKDNDDDDDATLEGTWSSEIDGTAFMAEFLADSGIEVPDDAELVMSVTLELDDGEYVFAIDKAATEKSLKKFLEAMVDPMVDMIYAAAEEDGLSKAEADDEFEAETGMTIKEYVESMIGDAVSIDDMLDSDAEMTGFYKEKGGKLYMEEDEEDLDDSDNYFTFTIKGKKLTLKEVNGNPLDMEDAEDIVSFPWVFTK